MTEKKSAAQLSMAGSIAGVAEALAVQPLDMVKTRFHLNTTSQNPSVLNALKSIYAEGGIFRFYRGILPEIAGMVPKSAMMYAGNALIRRVLVEQNGGVLDNKVAFASGFLSGYPEAISVMPFQVVKVRLQAKEHLGRYKNTFDCAQKIVSEEGFRGLFVGFGPTCWRNVKSRFQSELRYPGKVPEHRWTLLTLYNIWRTEGPRSIYKGYAPKALRMGLGGGVAMFAFELSCALMPDQPDM